MRETASGPAVLLGCPHPTLSGLCIPISKQVRWSSRSGFWTHCERIELSTGGDITPVFGRDFGAFPRETGLHRYHALSIWAEFTSGTEQSGETSKILDRRRLSFRGHRGGLSGRFTRRIVGEKLSLLSLVEFCWGYPI